MSNRRKKRKKFLLQEDLHRPTILKKWSDVSKVRLTMRNAMKFSMIITRFWSISMIWHWRVTEQLSRVFNLVFLRLDIASQDGSYVRKFHTIAKCVLENQVRTFPINFCLEYDEKDVEKSSNYALRVRIVADGKTRFITSSNVPVLTKGYGDVVDIKVEKIDLINWNLNILSDSVHTHCPLHSWTDFHRLFSPFCPCFHCLCVRVRVGLSQE